MNSRLEPVFNFSGAKPPFERQALPSIVKYENHDIEKPFSAREKQSLQKMIIAMAMKGYCYDPKARKSSVSDEIAKDITELGMNLGDDTVRKCLKQAAESVLPNIRT